jgi:hypothetical protein
MCHKCDSLRRELAASRKLATGLTDPASVLLMRHDIKALEERMAKILAELHPAAKQGRR